MDILLKKLFEIDRWEQAIEKGNEKGIDKTILRNMCNPEFIETLYVAIITDSYLIAPPHLRDIPKGDDRPDEFRTVCINEGVDRVVLSIVNDLLFELCPDMISKHCKSYQKGIGCGKVVQEQSQKIMKYKSNIVKADLTKFFDSVKIEYIDNVFDEIEKRLGKSKVINFLRAYYHSDLCLDQNDNVCTHYQSLKQGCAVASFLADAVLYDIDETISKMDVEYVRYSDDVLIYGNEIDLAYEKFESMLNSKELTLNPNKVEYIKYGEWFKFLGFSICKDHITLSKNRLKRFEKEIKSRTIKRKDVTFEQALNDVVNYIYKGDGKHSWASNVLPIINCDNDIKMMNCFVMDCLKAVKTGKKKMYGLGYDKNLIHKGKIGVIPFECGRNVAANKKKVGWIDGYLSLNAYKKAPRKIRFTLVQQL